MDDPFLFFDDDSDDHDSDDDAFEGSGVVSSSMMTIGQLGPPAWDNGEIDPLANVDNVVSGIGLSGRIMGVSVRVIMHMDDGGQAYHVNLCSSYLALAITSCSILSILSVHRFPNKLSVRSFWNRASFSNFCAVCFQQDENIHMRPLVRELWGTVGVE